MVATFLHFVALEGQTRWPRESCQLTVVVFAPSSIASLARVEHTMRVVIDQRGARAARRRGTDAPRAPGVFLVSPYHLGVKASAAVGRPRLHLRHQPSVRLASDSGDASEQSGWAQPLVQIRASGRRLPCSPAEDIAGAGLPIWIVQIHRRAQLTVTAQLRCDMRPHDTR